MLSNAVTRHTLPLIGDLSVASMTSGIQKSSKHVINLGAIEQNLKIWRFYICMALNVSHGVFTASEAISQSK